MAATTPTATPEQAVETVKTDVQQLEPAVLNAYHTAGPVVAAVKAGYKTTEFWVTVVGALLTQIGALHLPGKYGATITTVALAVSYVLSRGFAKAGAAKG